MVNVCTSTLENRHYGSNACVAKRDVPTDSTNAAAAE
ncbi:hypothetical protein F444_06324 [Phytophthora nicotianae P1976]|uniref:Uncharacterized protein n=1 Tax=Phytophthora nicotianae P1976 TaxID=1317066 RepID=A0A081AIX9_PHYNI|nr:hypothetical protein F444_06324 [Phytophthora nicotianae P1976]